MKADYKNWMPKSMIWGFAAGTVVSLGGQVDGARGFGHFGGKEVIATGLQGLLDTFAPS